MQRTKTCGPFLAVYFLSHSLLFSIKPRVGVSDWEFGGSLKMARSDQDQGQPVGVTTSVISLFWFGPVQRFGTNIPASTDSFWALSS